MVYAVQFGVDLFDIEQHVIGEFNVSLFCEIELAERNVPYGSTRSLIDEEYGQVVSAADNGAKGINTAQPVMEEAARRRLYEREDLRVETCLFHFPLYGEELNRKNGEVHAAFLPYSFLPPNAYFCHCLTSFR